MKHFSPEDLTVKVQEDFVEIHGKHNERQVSGRRLGPVRGAAPRPPLPQGALPEPSVPAGGPPLRPNRLRDEVRLGRTLGTWVHSELPPHPGRDQLPVLSDRLSRAGGTAGLGGPQPRSP